MKRERKGSVPAQKGAGKRHRDFEFNLRELAGSTGDFGTLFPLTIVYIVVNGLNPAGLCGPSAASSKAPLCAALSLPVKGGG
ncbi:MAG: hypothetical protein ACK2UA_15545 [Anaerolineae bacterium]